MAIADPHCSKTNQQTILKVKQFDIKTLQENLGIISFISLGYHNPSTSGCQRTAPQMDTIIPDHPTGTVSRAKLLVLANSSEKSRQPNIDKTAQLIYILFCCQMDI